MSEDAETARLRAVLARIAGPAPSEDELRLPAYEARDPAAYWCAVARRLQAIAREALK